MSINSALLISPDAAPDLVVLNDALMALETVHPRKSQVVELRFFGGLNLEETAEAMHVSVDTRKAGSAICEALAVTGASRWPLNSPKPIA